MKRLLCSAARSQFARSCELHHRVRVACSVRKTTGRSPVRSKLQSRMSGEKTSLPRALETNKTQRDGASAEVGSDTHRPESDRHAVAKKPRQRPRLRLLVVVDPLWSGASGSITLLERRAVQTKAAVQQYRDVLSRFMTSCLEIGPLLITQEQVDSDAMTYSNVLYMEGEKQHVGTKWLRP